MLVQMSRNTGLSIAATTCKVRWVPLVFGQGEVCELHSPLITGGERFINHIFVPSPSRLSKSTTRWYSTTRQATHNTQLGI
jgi:hypothetical protein